MPRAWSKKDERQYEHIKEGESERGRTARVAKRIAAATVNKQRSKEGRTKEQRAGGRSASTRAASTRSRTGGSRGRSRAASSSRSR